jgi:hypothetical protein
MTHSHLQIPQYVQRDPDIHPSIGSIPSSIEELVNLRVGAERGMDEKAGQCVEDAVQFEEDLI